jgi:hypothetical protein
MFSMYNAPSDRDYYEQFVQPEPEERCLCCGANEIEEHEEDCEANQAAREPQPERDEPAAVGRWKSHETA